MKYRKKPVVIEAIQFTNDDGTSYCVMFDTWGKKFQDETTYFPDVAQLKIKTLEGDHIARYGDWIIKGVAGEFYACKADIFAKSYEVAE